MARDMSWGEKGLRAVGDFCSSKRLGFLGNLVGNCINGVADMMYGKKPVGDPSSVIPSNGGSTPSSAKNGGAADPLVETVSPSVNENLDPLVEGMMEELDTTPLVTPPPTTHVGSSKSNGVNL